MSAETGIDREYTESEQIQFCHNLALAKLRANSSSLDEARELLTKASAPFLDMQAEVAGALTAICISRAAILRNSLSPDSLRLEGRVILNDLGLGGGNLAQAGQLTLQNVEEAIFSGDLMVPVITFSPHP